MSLTSRFLVIISVLALAGSSFALDRNAFTFTKYDLELRANPEEQMIAVRGKVRLRNDSDKPQSDLALQISSTLDWRMIELNGTAIEYISEPYTTDIDHTGKVTEAVVRLPSAVAPKGTIELEVGYNGTIPRDATRLTRIGLADDKAAASDWDRVSSDFTGVRGIGHVVWYPVATEAANLSENSLFPTIAHWQAREAHSSMKTKLCWITDEDHSLSVVSNGTFESIGGANTGEGNRGGCSTYSFENLDQSIPTFAMGQFEMMTRPAISLYYALGHQIAATEYALAAEKVQPQVEDWFGKTSEKVQVVELPERDAVPFETGAMIFTSLLANDRKLVELTMAHQLTHAAFHSSRPWINEGLAHFAQALVREHQDGRKAAIDFMDAQLPALVAAESQNSESKKPSGDATQSLVSTTDEIYYRTKAMFVWWMLRDMIGDNALQAVLKNYHATQDKDPAYVQRLVSAQNKRDLEWFFDDWVYRDRGLSDLKTDSVVPRETLNNSFVVAITAENLGGAGAEVPITVATKNGEQTVRLLVPAHQKAITRISTPGKPASVQLNDGSVPESDMDNNAFNLPE